MTTPDVSGDIMLTTMDNPWSPFENWEEWYAWDQVHGYDTPGYLARVSNFSSDLSADDQERVLRSAIQEILQLNVRGVYKVIRRGEAVKV
jgi:hypothetical protein